MYHPTLGSREIKRKKKNCAAGGARHPRGEGEVALLGVFQLLVEGQSRLLDAFRMLGVRFRESPLQPLHHL